MELGEGQLQLRSDQINNGRDPSFAFALAGGHRLGEHARVGLVLNGWLIQAYNLYDPTKGSSVSCALAVVDVLPDRKKRLFVRGGVGGAFYTDNAPGAQGGSGLGWTVGAGYEIPVAKHVAIAPSVAYAAGNLGDDRLAVPAQSNRRFSVIEFKAAFVFHWGRSK